MNQANELYGSHLPILTKIMEITSGPVMELGMGMYSTPLLHTLCFLQKRFLFSLDNDRKWLSKNLEWATDTHDVMYVSDWDIYKDEMLRTHWSVVLVDHKPARRRKIEIRLLANHANFIVVHDTEPEQEKFFKYHWVFPEFKYRYDYTKLTPHTTVLSNFVDLSSLDIP